MRTAEVLVGEHGHGVWLRKNTRDLVTKVRNDKVKRLGVKRGLEEVAAHRSSLNLPSATAELRGCSWAAWWLSGYGAWGKTERGSRGFL